MSSWRPRFRRYPTHHSKFSLKDLQQVRTIFTLVQFMEEKIQGLEDQIQRLPDAVTAAATAQLNQRFDAIDQGFESLSNQIGFSYEVAIRGLLPGNDVH